MKKPKHHNVSSNLGNILVLIFLIPLVSSIFFMPFEVTIIVIVMMFTSLLTPLMIRHYVVVKNEMIYKYDPGEKYSLNGKPMAKNNKPSMSIDIKKIVKIEQIKKNHKTTGLLIYVDYHLQPTTLKTKSASELLEEIILVNNDIPVT